ncbi:hypothetical protein [Streptomyces sp. NPDC053427]|uniref:hypothetical protein n=1 Tax=Streptomyces sp. NPDC053427 TaxID=3365701 RepID=UPI0037D2F3B1
MKSSRVGRRVAGTAVTALMLTAGAVAMASPAAAKANSIALGKVALDTRQASVIKADVTYSCDPGSDVHVAATVTKLDKADGKHPSIATGTLPNSKLVCDADKHVARLTLRPKPHSSFRKGDDVKAAAAIVTPAGAHYADAEKAATL